MKRPTQVLVAAAVLVLLVVLIAWWWTSRQAEARFEEERAALEQQQAALQQAGSEWARALAASQATATFRAFAAGIHPLVLSGAQAQLDQAIGALLEMPGIVFVHVVGPDGSVLASSDRKLLTTGRLPPEADWVLAAAELARRPGDRPGVEQLASSISGPAGAAGQLWIAYDVEAVAERARPAGWPAPGAPAEPGPAPEPGSAPAPAPGPAGG